VNPGDLVAACIGEIYRYRFTTRVRFSIDEATQTVRAEREAIEKDEEKHLVF
jgi:hypothetical protein